MKILRQLSFLSLLAFSTMLANASPFSISETEINRYLDTKLAEKVPLENKVGIPGLFQLDYKLSDLVTKIGQTEEKRVEILGTIDGILRARGKKYDANIQLNFDTVPFYDPETGSLYLRDVRLKEWQATPEKYQNEMQMFLPLLTDGLTSVLNNTPVYTLDDSNMKEALIKKFGKAIVVEKGELKLEASLF